MKKETINHQQPLCENQLNSGSPLLQSLQAFVSTLLALRSRLIHQFVHVSQATLVTLRVSLNEVTANKRFLTALFFLLVIAPCSGGLYKLFDPTVVMAESWYSPNEYYGNYRYLLMGVRGNLFVFFSILGAFFLFPARYKASYFLAAPLGYVVAELLKKLHAMNNDEFNSISSMPSVILCICLVVGFLLSVDYLLYRHHHIKRKYWAHIVGIIRTPGIPASDKIKLLEGEIKLVETTYYSIY